MKDEEKVELALPGQPSQSEPLDSWTEQEKWVWKRICEGKKANLNEAIFTGLWFDPEKPDNYPQRRVLRQEFLETILLNELFKTKIPRQGVLIKDACFKDEIDLSNAKIDHELGFEDCEFQSFVNLVRLKTCSLVYFISSIFTGELNADGFISESSLFMRNSVFKKVDLRSAKVEDNMDLSGSKFNGSLFMPSLEVGSNLFMKGVEFKDEVVLTGANIRENVEMDDSKYYGDLEMGSMEVRGYVHMRNAIFGISESSKVNLTGSSIGGLLDMGGSNFVGKLIMNSIEVKGHLYMNQFESLKAVFNEVNLVGANIGGSIDMSGSLFLSKLLTEGMHLEGDLYMHYVEFSRKGKVSLTFSSIGGSLLISGSIFPLFNLSGTQIQKELYLGSEEAHSLIHSSAKWYAEAKLVLRNTEVGAIQDLPNAWPNKIELEGFSFSRLGGFGARGTDNMGSRKVEWLKQWLDRDESYSPQPYEQLATVLQNAGYKDKANDILFAGKQREFKETELLSLSKFWLFLQLIFVGYGYRISFALWWVIVLIFIGAAVFQSTPQSEINNMPYGLIFSFDTLLPIVELNKIYDQIQLASWQKYYFYFHKVMGYILASFIIAGLSGITKK